jgi:hypothetical protein
MLRIVLVCAVAASIAAQATQALARGPDEMPKYDIKRACQALSLLSEARSAARSAEDATRSCMASEEQARERLASEWSQFAPADRTMCLGVSQAGSVSAVYTELATCLEMTRDSAVRNRSAAVRQP